MKKLLYTFVLLLVCQHTFAQHTIETRLGYSYVDKYEFSDEWQYLSTDLYLFNGTQFNRVLTEVEKGVKKQKKKYDDNLEYLFITAQLKNLKLFGNDQVVYPLFNFNVTTDKNEVTTQVSDHLEVVRIIDKMPISAATNAIDASIQAKAVTSGESDQVFNLVASQLLNISKMATPSGAVLSLVGEFGNLMNARTTRKEYKFSSTIRLYEGQNFDTRLHSVKVYVFVPGEVKTVTLKPAKLTSYLSGGGVQKLERKQLEELIGYKEYPYMVVANYKSLYKMDVLTGDEVTQDLIEKRRQKIETAFTSGLMNNETYRQEKLYVDYLRIFADMKQHLNTYRLNYRNNSPDVNAKNLFGIMQEYKRLKGTFEAREQEFKGNTTYQHIFKPEYAAILNNAALYLEGDHNLKSGKVLINTLRELENDPKAWNTPDKREAALARLYAVELPRPDFLSSSVEGEAIVKLIKKLEDLQYEEVFAKEVHKLSETPASDETVNQRNTLQDKATASKCHSCRDKVKTALEEYNKRYDSFKLKQALQTKTELNQKAEQLALNYLKQQQCIDSNLKTVASASNGQNLYMARMQEKNTELAAAINSLEELNKKQPDDERNLQKVNDYNKRLQQLMQEVETTYQVIYAQDKALCNCGDAG